MNTNLALKRIGAKLISVPPKIRFPEALEATEYWPNAHRLAECAPKKLPTIAAVFCFGSHFGQGRTGFWK